MTIARRHNAFIPARLEPQAFTTDPVTKQRELRPAGVPPGGGAAPDGESGQVIVLMNRQVVQSEESSVAPTVVADPPATKQRTIVAAAQEEANAVIEQALREQELEESNDLAFWRQQIRIRALTRQALRNEVARAREVLAGSDAAGGSTRIYPPFIPAPIEVKTRTLDTHEPPPPQDPIRIVIDGQELELPPEIYTRINFDDAVKVIEKIRTIPTQGPQACGASVNNELVSNAFQFLVTNTVLRSDGGGNADRSYSDFVAELEEYGISATADQADGVAGGTVTLEGGRQVSDGVSDGNLDYKDLEWNQASQALAEAIGIEVGDLFTDPEVFQQEYEAIAHLLADHDFNPADNDILVEVLLIASMLEKAGANTPEGALTTREQLESYISNLADTERALGREIDADQLALTRQFIEENSEAQYADLSEAAAGTEEAVEGAPREGNNRDRRLSLVGAGADNVRRILSGQANLQVGAASAEIGGSGRSFVAEQANQLTAALRDEHRLKLRLLDIDLGPQMPGELARNQGEAWNTLGQLRSINMDRKLPVMRELAAYIVANRPVLEHLRAEVEQQRAPVTLLAAASGRRS